MGVLFAIIAMLFWGVGDFLIQKSTRQVGKIRIKSFFSCLKRRRFGNLVVLFYITFIGAVIISPFISKEIINFINDFDVYNWAMLGALSLVMLLGAIFDFKGLKMGKISVIEPVFAFEIPITALLAAAIIKESLNFGQTILIIALFVGIVLVTTRSFKIFSRGGWKLEKGVVYAMLGVVCFGSVNFLIGISAR
jgi:drug/metabolite transporter (DMT)-like permease